MQKLYCQLYKISNIKIILLLMKLKCVKMKNYLPSTKLESLLLGYFKRDFYHECTEI